MIIASVQNTGLKSNSQLLLYTISEQMEFEVKTTLSLMLVPPPHEIPGYKSNKNV